MNIDMDTDVSWMQQIHTYMSFRWIWYKLDTKSMDINMDISWIIKTYDYKINIIAKWIINQINSMLMRLYIFRESL